MTSVFARDPQNTLVIDRHSTPSPLRCDPSKPVATAMLDSDTDASILLRLATQLPSTPPRFFPPLNSHRTRVRRNHGRPRTNGFNRDPSGAASD
jgi:hypothetical protein